MAADGSVKDEFTLTKMKAVPASRPGKTPLNA